MKKKLELFESLKLNQTKTGKLKGGAEDLPKSSDLNIIDDLSG